MNMIVTEFRENIFFQCVDSKCEKNVVHAKCLLLNLIYSYLMNDCLLFKSSFS